jgi:hypothetical protein
MRWNKDASFIPPDALEILQTDSGPGQNPLQKLGQMKEKLYREANEGMYALRWW